MILNFNNYFVKLEQQPNGCYSMTIFKITGPASINRELIATESITSLESLQSGIARYIPASHLPTF